jgi:hypothetical protein
MEVSSLDKVLERGEKWVLSEGGESGCFRFLFKSNKHVLRLDHGDGHTTPWTYEQALSCALQSGGFYGAWIWSQKNCC